MKPRRGKEVPCAICKKMVYQKPSELKRDKVAYCSRACHHKGMLKEKPVLTCDHCSKEYAVYPSQLKWNQIREHKKNFCSTQCQNKFYSGDNHPNWIGGSIEHATGYIKDYVDKKYTARHRIFMEELVGRKLSEDEVVHHKNGNKHDNRIENLEIMTRSEHAKHHISEREKDLSTGRLK